ncbi:MAG: histidine phosphatase family protein [Gammaproteobacteria bacterium]|nr:histidine phosphatase family protein [Gammaproteobacteria bacterium]
MSDKHLITTIDLLRHGECEGGEIFRGTTDVALTDEGWKNMQRVIEQQQPEENWDHVISSPLLRCRLFSESLNELHQIPLNIEDNFREMHFGDWEGKEVQTIWAKEKEKVESIYSSPHTFQAPNGEAMTDFGARVISSTEKVLQEHKGKHILLPQHGGTIRVVLTHLLSMPLSSMSRFHIPYACFSRIQIHHAGETEQVNLVFHNIPCRE